MKGPNKAARPDDKRLRPGGRKVPIVARVDPGLDAWLRSHAASKGETFTTIIELALTEYRARNESLGKFLARQDDSPVSGR